MQHEQDDKFNEVSRYPRVKLATIALSVFSIAGLLCLSGCDDTEKTNNNKNVGGNTSTQVLSQKSSILSKSESSNNTSTTCTNVIDSDDFMESTQCEATNAFDMLTQQENRNLSFEPYLKGFRIGINQARQAKPKLLNSQNPSYEEQKGHEDGYQSVLTSLGMKNNFSENDPNTQAQEFQQLQKEAQTAFNNSKLDTNNPFLETAFINGYLSGGRTVLSMPTSMEGMNFLTGDNEATETDKTNLSPPSDNAPATVHAFYNGFISGTKAMEDSIKESFDRFMNQMQEGEMGTDGSPFDEQNLKNQQGNK